MIHGHWLQTMNIPGAYDLQDLASEKFPEFFLHLPENGYVGGNITAPHKEAAYRLVHRRDDAAEAVGAVNTVWLEGSTLLVGNSDIHGFIANLDESAPAWDVAGGHAVVIGAGGAARSATYGLVRRGFDVSVVNRTLARAAELATRFGPHVRAFGYDALPRLLPAADLLVNCTALGMVGKPSLAIDIAPLKRSAVVCDVVYVPLETPLLVAARAHGHRTVDGLGMLLHQAGFGFAKWFGEMPVVTPELRAIVEADIHAKTAAPGARSR